MICAVSLLLVVVIALVTGREVLRLDRILIALLGAVAIAYLLAGVKEKPGSGGGPPP